jgi:3-deoxy-D-manno-octulosonic-acid transferase
MIRWLYALAMVLAQPLLRVKLRRRALAEPVYGEHLEERFGQYAGEQVQMDAGRPVVWVHAVSLGEARAAAVLVTQLRQRIPGMRLLLTHGTATGRAQGASLLQPGDMQVWQPWDTPGAVGRFLTHFQPQVGLLVETEVWPNMVVSCAARNVPLCLVNARFSEKSLRQARRLAWLARPAYRGLRAVWAQSRPDAERLELLGAPVAGVMGNFKFDATPDAAQLAQGHQWRAQAAKPVVVFASSREGEEQTFLEIVTKNLPPAPTDLTQEATKSIATSVQWLVVPRHPQRFELVAELFQAAGLRVSRRSTWTDGPQDADVWIGDSVGEMAMYFGLSHVALLGGSFAPLGGQNLIEAAACGCPVVMGPHTFNFSEAAELALSAGAAMRCPDLSQAVDRASHLAHSPVELARAVEASLALGLRHRGAAARTAAAIASLLLR